MKVGHLKWLWWWWLPKALMENIIFNLLLLIYFPSTQLFPRTMVFKNLHAHTEKVIAGAGGGLGGGPVTRISMCTYSTRCGPQTPHLNFTHTITNSPMDF